LFFSSSAQKQEARTLPFVFIFGLFFVLHVVREDRTVVYLRCFINEGLVLSKLLSNSLIFFSFHFSYQIG
jgi:hypothetical protein